MSQIDINILKANMMHDVIGPIFFWNGKNVIKDKLDNGYIERERRGKKKRENKVRRGGGNFQQEIEKKQTKLGTTLQT